MDGKKLEILMTAVISAVFRRHLTRWDIPNPG